MKRAAFYFSLFLGLAFTAQSARAQELQVSEHPFEIGGQLSLINLSSLESIVTIPGATIRVGQFDQGYVGFGGRVGYNVNRYLTLEAEGNYFPKRNFSEVEQSRKAQFFAGARVGVRWEKFGVFAKARPGIMNFSSIPSHANCGNPFDPNFTCAEETQTNFVLDLGGVVEYYPSPRVIIRFDAGDTIVHFKEVGPTPSVNSSIFTPADTTHNFQASIGLGFRF